MTVTTNTPAGQVGASISTQKPQPAIESNAILDIAQAALTKSLRQNASTLLHRNGARMEGPDDILNSYVINENTDDVCVRTQILLKNIYDEVFNRELNNALLQGRSSSLLSALGHINPNNPGQQTVIGGRVESRTGPVFKKSKEIDTLIENILHHPATQNALYRAIQTSEESASNAPFTFAQTRVVPDPNRKYNYKKNFRVDSQPVSFCQPAGETVINFLSVEEKTSEDIKQAFIHAMQNLLASDDLNLEDKAAKRLLQRFKGALRSNDTPEANFLSWFMDKELSRARNVAYRQAMRTIAEHSKEGVARAYFEHLESVERQMQACDGSWTSLVPSAFASVQCKSTEPMVFTLSQALARVYQQQPYIIEQHEQFFEEYRFDQKKDDGTSTRLQNVKVKLNNLFTCKQQTGVEDLLDKQLMPDKSLVTPFEDKVLKAYLGMTLRTRSSNITDEHGQKQLCLYVDESEFGWGAVNLAALAMVPTKLTVYSEGRILDLSNVVNRLDYLNNWFAEKDERVFLDTAYQLTKSLVHPNVRKELSSVQSDLRKTLTDLNLIENVIKPALSKPMFVRVKVLSNLINKNNILTGDMTQNTDFNFIHGDRGVGDSGWWQYTVCEHIDEDCKAETDPEGVVFFSTTTEFKFAFRPLCLKEGEGRAPYMVDRLQEHKVLTILHDCLGKYESPLYSGCSLDDYGYRARVSRRALIIAHPEAYILTSEQMMELWGQWADKQSDECYKRINLQNRDVQVLFKQAFALAFMVYSFLVSRIVAKLFQMANDICINTYNTTIGQVHLLRAHPFLVPGVDPALSKKSEKGNEHYYALVYSTSRSLESEASIPVHIQGAKLGYPEREYLPIKTYELNSHVGRNVINSLMSKNRMRLLPHGTNPSSYDGTKQIGPSTWVIAFSLRDAAFCTMPGEQEKEQRYWHQTIEKYRIDKFRNTEGKIGMFSVYEGSRSDIVSEDEPGGSRTMGTAINEIIADIRNRAEQLGHIDDSNRPRVVLVSKLLYSKRLGGAKEDVFKGITHQFIDYVKSTFEDLDIIPLTIHELSGVKSSNGADDKNQGLFYELISDNAFASIVDHTGFEEPGSDNASYAKKQQVLCSFATKKTIGSSDPLSAKIHSTAVSYIYETDTRSQNKELDAEERKDITDALRTIHILNAQKDVLKLSAFEFLKPDAIQKVGEISLPYGKGYGSLVLNLQAFLHAMHMHSIDKGTPASKPTPLEMPQEHATLSQPTEEQASPENDVESKPQELSNAGEV